MSRPYFFEAKNPYILKVVFWHLWKPKVFFQNKPSPQKFQLTLRFGRKRSLSPLFSSWWSGTALFVGSQSRAASSNSWTTSARDVRCPWLKPPWPRILPSLDWPWQLRNGSVNYVAPKPSENLQTNWWKKHWPVQCPGTCFLRLWLRWGSDSWERVEALRWPDIRRVRPMFSEICLGAKLSAPFNHKCHKVFFKNRKRSFKLAKLEVGK